MKCRLVSFTVPCIDELPLDSNILDLIAYCARVSNPTNQANNTSSDKLINYLLKHKHFSPFEMADATLEIETTRDIARQMLRHRSFSFQEFSQRYADPTQMEFEISEARLQDPKNRQNSIETDDMELHDTWKQLQTEVIDTALAAYSWAIHNGIAKEVARKVLPEGLTPSKLYIKGSIRSWIHYLEVRTDESTQKEHREVAIECAKAIAEIFPMTEKFVPALTSTQEQLSLFSTKE